jgi:hypothetical protein
MTSSVSWFSDVDLIAKLTIVEDQFVERKSKSDKTGWLRTTVAFANSTPVGNPAVLFIGVDDDGIIADNVKVEDVMKSYSDFIGEHAWPPIYTAPRTLAHQGKTCIAVIIPGSETRPHFAGKSYVRSGTQTIEASDNEYKTLIAQNLSKARELLKEKGQMVTSSRRRGPYSGSSTARLVDCNAFWLTLDFGSGYISHSLTRIELSFDHQLQQLRIEIEE